MSTNAVTSPRDDRKAPKKRDTFRARANHFTPVPHALLDDVEAGRLPALSLLVYVAVRSYATFGTGEGAWPSHRRLAARAGISYRAVIDQLKHLREAGWLDWDSGASAGGSNVYTVFDLPGNRVQDTHTPSAPYADPPVQDTHTPPAPGADYLESGTESPSTESQRTRNQGAGATKVGWSTSLGGSSVDDLDFAEALTDATAQGLGQNAKVLQACPSGPKPIRPDWEHSLTAAKALREAGVPIGFATYFYRSAATQYRPTAKSPQIGSLKYALAACLNAWAEEQAKTRGAAHLSALAPIAAPASPQAPPRTSWSPIPGVERAARRNQAPTPIGEIDGFNLIRQSLGQAPFRKDVRDLPPSTEESPF